MTKNELKNQILTTAWTWTLDLKIHHPSLYPLSQRDDQPNHSSSKVLYKTMHQFAFKLWQISKITSISNKECRCISNLVKYFVSMEGIWMIKIWPMVGLNPVPLCYESLALSTILPWMGHKTNILHHICVTYWFKLRTISKITSISNRECKNIKSGQIFCV